MVEQHRAQFIVIALCTTAAITSLILAFFNYDELIVVASSLILVVFGGLTLASYYRLSWANMSALTIITLVASIALALDVQTRQEFSPAVFIPPMMALILAGHRGITISGLIVFVAPTLVPVSGVNPYLNPFNILISVFVIVGITLGRLVLDTMVARSNAAEEAAHAAEEVALREAKLAQERAAEIEQKAREQERLIELIGILELPLVALADGLILLPLVGHLDTRRLQAISTHLLDHIARQRISTVVLDLAGVALIDTQVAHHLQRLIYAIGLLGAKVCLTGIRAEVATMMTGMGVSLSSVQIARTPQEVIAQAGRRAVAG